MTTKGNLYLLPQRGVFRVVPKTFEANSRGREKGFEETGAVGTAGWDATDSLRGGSRRRETGGTKRKEKDCKGFDSLTLDPFCLSPDSRFDPTMPGGPEGTPGRV